MAPQTVSELLIAQGELRPAAPALMATSGEFLSYGALRAEVERQADALAVMGYGRGCRIAVALPNGPRCAVALLTAMTAGTCAPIDPRLDPATCGEFLRRFGIVALLVASADETFDSAARTANVAVLEFGAAEGLAGSLAAWRSGPQRPPVARAAPAPDDLALVMRTSGTTGQSRVVPITQAQVMRNARLQPLGPDDRVLGMAPLFTRSALGLSLLASLASGSCIIQTPGFDAASFVDWLDTLRPTCYSASATVQMAVIDALERRAPRMPHSLRFARASSMTLPAAVQAKLESLLGVPVIQACGSTETGTVAQNPLPPGVRKPGSIGVSVGLEIRIADPDGNALPTGEIGEMLLRGPGVMSGYEQDPEANRRAFHGSWYRSGDLAYVDADGYVFITGRVRELINRGGIKVSPGEVDRKFMEHPEVREAATFSIPHPTLGEDVITAIALRERSAVTPAHLRQFALENLAPSKAPSQVVLVDALPRTALGKVRRNALGHLLRESLSASYVRPRDDDELLIAALFAEILARSPIGADDHFFLLGGDSLTAARLIARLEARCGVVLAPLAVFEAPTVAQLAARLRAAPRAAALPAIPKLVRHRRA